MSSYSWITIGVPDDYDQIVAIVDPVFDPKSVAVALRNAISPGVKGVLIETGYIDKDYRSTFYNFYAKKGRVYRSDCVRLHFFDGQVDFDQTKTALLCPDDKPEDHYYGYIVLRPTLVSTIGRSILSPGIRKGAHGMVIQSEHQVHLLGYKLRVWGFPSMAQHTDIAVCAHVSCWAILRHYSERFPQHRELLIHEIFPGDRDEHGAVLHAGIVRDGDALKLLVRDVFPAKPGQDYVPGQHGYRALSPQFIHKHITACRDQGLAYLAVHNHDCDDSVGFSHIDNASHERG